MITTDGPEALRPASLGTHRPARATAERELADGSLFLNYPSSRRVTDTDEATPVVSNVSIPNLIGTLLPQIPLQPNVRYAPGGPLVSRKVGEKRYELNDHLGNVRVVITDRKLCDTDNLSDSDPDTDPTDYLAEVKERMDYYPFGFLSSHSAGPEGYRFGFNGQEKVDEINNATGTHNTAMFWEYDTRTGRRWNLDPKPQISISDYAVMGLNPIFNTDVLGDKWKTTADEKQANNMSKSAAKRESKYRKDAEKFTAKAEQLTAAGKTEKAAEMMTAAEESLRGAAEMAQAQTELAEMGATQEVTFAFQRNIVVPGTAMMVNHTYMASDGTVVMPWTTEGNAFHEAKHGWQHLNGNIELIAGKGGGNYWDAIDEQEAYRREFFINAGGVRALPNLGKTEIRLSTDITIQFVKGILSIDSNGNRVPIYQTAPSTPRNKPGSPADKP